MFLHPEVFETACQIDKEGIYLENDLQYNTFHTLIIPLVKTVSVNELTKIVEFYEAGGRVIFTTQLPAKSTEPAKTDKSRT